MKAVGGKGETGKHASADAHTHARAPGYSSHRDAWPGPWLYGWIEGGRRPAGRWAVDPVGSRQAILIAYAVTSPAPLPFLIHTPNPNPFHTHSVHPCGSALGQPWTSAISSAARSPVVVAPGPGRRRRAGRRRVRVMLLLCVLCLWGCVGLKGRGLTCTHTHARTHVFVHTYTTEEETAKANTKAPAPTPAEEEEDGNGSEEVIGASPTSAASGGGAGGGGGKKRRAAMEGPAGCVGLGLLCWCGGFWWVGGSID